MNVLFTVGEREKGFRISLLELLRHQVDAHAGSDGRAGVADGEVGQLRDVRLLLNHERLDRNSFWDKQVLVGRTIYWTRTELDRPGKVLVRHPVLLLLLPHLWIVLARMLRAGHLVDAVALLPWMVLGEVARIRGFHLERRERRGRVGPSVT